MADQPQVTAEHAATQQADDGTDIESIAQPEGHLEIDDELEDDADSAYGSSLASSSASLTSSITNYTYENGRRYHAFREGQYFLPNDETEQYRLDLQHHIYRLCLGGALYCAPVQDLKAILDVGTGTGLWAIEVADEYPGAVVVGTDLSPIQPDFAPPNVKFYVDDFESDWEFPGVGKFDFIHWRSLSGSTANWTQLYRRAMENLKPGAWLEIQEYDTWVYSDDDEKMEKAPCTLDWVDTTCKVAARFGKPLFVAPYQKKWMEEAGFQDVQERVIKVPLGPWTRDRSLKLIGQYERAHMKESVEAHSMALYTRVLGYSTDDAKKIFEKVRGEFDDKSLHLYTVYRFIYGKRPEI